jgi:hypothetical protein
MQRRHADLLGERCEAADGSQCRGNRLRLEPPAGRQAAPQPAQFLLVEQRRGGTAQPLVDDKTDRVRTDVDNRNRPATIEAPRRSFDDGKIDRQFTLPDRAGGSAWLR